LLRYLRGKKSKSKKKSEIPEGVDIHSWSYDVEFRDEEAQKKIERTVTLGIWDFSGEGIGTYSGDLKTREEEIHWRSPQDCIGDSSKSLCAKGIPLAHKDLLESPIHSQYYY
jgi:hypothetical protein